MSNSMIETLNLKKTYKHSNGNITLFDKLNIKIKRGELVALVGPSGSGKSSLLHLLALLDEPSKGGIKINNIPTNKLNDEEKDKIRREKISIIFQDNNLLNDFTAIENVMMPLLIKNINREEAKKKAQKILRSVKILERSQHFPNELSGGEQQRLVIARAIVNDPKLIIADEPTGNLDPEVAEKILQILLEINTKGTSIIMTTHNYSLMNKYKKDIYLCEDGRFFKKN